MSKEKDEIVLDDQEYVVDDIVESRKYRLESTSTKAMQSILAKFEKSREKSQKTKHIPRVPYATGFYALDLYLGKDIPDEKDPSIIHKNQGLRDGTLLTIGGKTHLGKSVFAVNIAGNIVRPFIKKGLPSWIEYFTPEEGLEDTWMQTCAGLGADAVRKGFINVTHRSIEGTSTEGLTKLVFALYKLKTESPDEFQYDTIDIYGNPIRKYVPTVLVIDSWTNVTPQDFLSAETFNETYYMRKNGRNGATIEKLRPLMLEANIITIAIVHVGKKTELTGRPSKDYAALGNSMSVSGGKQFHYETEVGIVLQRFLYHRQDKLEDALKMNIEGKSSAIEVVVYKNRMGQHDASTTFALVSDKSRGFDPLKSLLLDAYEYRGIFGNAGSYYFLKSNPDDRFYKKDVCSKLTEDPIFAKRFGHDYRLSFKDYTEYKENMKEVMKTEALLDAIF